MLVYKLVETYILQPLAAARYAIKLTREIVRPGSPAFAENYLPT